MHQCVLLLHQQQCHMLLRVSATLTPVRLLGMMLIVHRHANFGNVALEHGTTMGWSGSPWLLSMQRLPAIHHVLELE